jgi:hypothetical protein
MRLLLLIVLATSCATKPASTPAQILDTAPRAYTGLQFSAQSQKFNPPLKPNVTEAIRVENVMPDSPAARAGFKAGDLILDEKSPLELSKKLSRDPVGTRFKLKVLSGVKHKELIIVSAEQSPSQGTLLYTNPAKLWKVPTQNTYLEKKLTEINNKKLKDIFKKTSVKGDALRPNILRFTQENPLSTHDVSQELISRLRKCEDKPECLQTLSLISSNKILPKNSSAKPIASHLDYISSVLIRTQKIHATALSKLSKKEKLYLENNIDELSNRFMESLYVHEDTFIGRKNRFYELTRIIDKVDLSKAQEALLFLTTHLSKEYFLKLKQDLKNHKEHAVKETPLGKIIIAGLNDDDHSELSKDNVALLVDLGGDDLYRDVSGSIIDLAGDDRYESSLAWTLGATKMGTAMFMDFEGDDSYECGVHCLGSSFLGGAFFADYEGNDRYTSQVYSQGTAFSGVTLFLDAKGDDVYQSFGFSQGVGIAGGLGILIDKEGNDVYKSFGIRPSGYGDVGQFESWSQGVGIGLRFFVSGGMGLLYDKNGEDKFEAGTFSQGGGYAFGWGALINDGTSDDQYKAMRYGQGFAAHGAAGTFMDIGGNDSYSNMSSVCQSLAWDLSVSYFEDKAGNDRHQTGGHCLGAASHSSYAFFLDLNGVDTYVGKELPITTPVPSEYHKTPSLGYFLDSGSLEDKYEVFKNNSCQTREGTQLICDE